MTTQLKLTYDDDPKNWTAKLNWLIIKKYRTKQSLITQKLIRY